MPIPMRLTRLCHARLFVSASCFGDGARYTAINVRAVAPAWNDSKIPLNITPKLPPAATLPQPASFAALRYPGFRAQIGTFVLAMMADNVEHVISYWMVFQKFHSPALAGFAVVSHWLPFLVFSVATGARSLLITILGDAVHAGRLDRNPAERRRGRRGKVRAQGRAPAIAHDRSAANVITPLQAICLAERTALLSGCDIDFVMNITGPWTGVRWGELIHPPVS